MLLKTLRTTHPCYDAIRYSDLDALAKGGASFHDKITKFLPQNMAEPAAMYSQRVQQAHYTSYVGAIINSYVSWLFAAEFSVQARHRETGDAIAQDPFYSKFHEDIGDETSFPNFMRERFRETLIGRRSYWVVELPSDQGRPPEDRAEWEQRGLGRVTLRALPYESVLDWAVDDLGVYQWVVTHTKDLVRGSWAEDRNTVVETWRVYDRDDVHIFELRYPKSRVPSDNDDVPLVARTPHGFKRVPVVGLEVPVEICIGEQTHDAQLEHFRLDNALSWLTRRTCYAQPLFKLADADRIPTMGAGYALVLSPDDEFGWTSPPVAPFDVLGRQVEAKRDEIYRVTQTLAQAVDNNAETVGRSADSKEIDAAATRIMLTAYGTYVASAIERTYELVSEARGELDYEWSVEGFNGYDTATVSSLLANVKAARQVGIPSVSLHKELCHKVAVAMLPGGDQVVKNQIRDEIEKASFEVSSSLAPDDVLEAKAESLRSKANLDTKLARQAPAQQDPRGRQPSPTGKSDTSTPEGSSTP